MDIRVFWGNMVCLLSSKAARLVRGFRVRDVQKAPGRFRVYPVPYLSKCRYCGSRDCEFYVRVLISQAYAPLYVEVALEVKRRIGP